MRITISATILFLLLFIVLNLGEYATDAKSVSDLNPVFSYEDATSVAESMR